MKTISDYIDERDQLDAQLAEVKCLADALSLAVWHLGQLDLPSDAHQTRNAVIGISRALDREMANTPA